MQMMVMLCSFITARSADVGGYARLIRTTYTAAASSVPTQAPPKFSSAEGVADGSGVFCVADGMGGGAFGEEASLEAVKLLREAGGPASKKDVDKYIRAANALVCSAAEEKGAGLMGTTLAYVGFDGRRALAANVGDSRIYRLRDGELEQLSRDPHRAQFADIHGYTFRGGRGLSIRTGTR